MPETRKPSRRIAAASMIVAAYEASKETGAMITVEVDGYLVTVTPLETTPPNPADLVQM